MKISVIIPAYNVEAELINRCVDRLLNQKFNDYEIIVINDGSDKEHEDVLINLQSKSTKIKVLNQENRGVSSARNRGTELAAGEYICYVDADDMVSDNYLEEAYNIAVEKQADIVIGGNGYTNKQYKMQDDAAIVDTYNGDEINALRKYMVGNRLMKLGEEVVLGQGPWNRLVKADIAKKTVFDTSLKIGEDIVWNYQLLDRAKRVCVAHKLWYWYYINPVSASRKFRPDAISESRRSLDEIKKCINVFDDEEYRAYCSRCISDLKRVYNTCLNSRRNVKNISFSELYGYPWKDAMGKRYFFLCSNKEKVVSLLYKFHMLFVFYDLKELISKIKK